MNVHDVMELSWEDLIGIIDLDKDQTENASLDLADILEKWKHKASLGFFVCKRRKMAGGTPLGQMYIELGLDVSKFNPSLTSAKNAVKYFQNNVKALDSTLKNNGKSTELLKAKYKSLGQAIEAQKSTRSDEAELR